MEKWEKWIGVLIAVLGALIGILTTFSEIELCKRIYIVITIVALTLVCVISLRLFMIAKNRPQIAIPNKTASSPVKYLSRNARALYFSVIIFSIIFIFLGFNW
jgi:hypothetical protein